MRLRRKNKAAKNITQTGRVSEGDDQCSNNEEQSNRVGSMDLVMTRSTTTVTNNLAMGFSCDGPNKVQSDMECTQGSLRLNKHNSLT
ncbi:unnamed protein product [Arabidopsis halleri]